MTSESLTPILHVEDDVLDIELVKRAFKRANILNPIYNAYDGVEALKTLQTLEPQPCLMLIDLNMPRMNGIEFLEKIRTDKGLKKNIAFILTTSNRDEDKAKCYDLNAAGYVLKENLDTLAEMLGQYCRINEIPQGSYISAN